MHVDRRPTAMKSSALACVIAALLSACGTPSRPGADATPSPSVATASQGTAAPEPSGGSTSKATPTPSPSRSQAVAGEWPARSRLDDRYTIFYCDPDSYPVGVDDQTRRQRARDWYAQNKNTEEAQTIRAGRGYREPLTDDQIATVYEDHKRLRVISMERIRSGWKFRLIDGDETKAEMVDGTVTDTGAIRESARTRAEPSCPICLEPQTLIATPAGSVYAAAIRVGDLVWSLDSRGSRIAVRVTRIVRRPVPSPHLMVRIKLRDGRTVTAAAAHPDADGRTVWSLHPGDAMDGSTVARIELVSSLADATYDLLPHGPTGDYWANGILLGSTLR